MERSETAFTELVGRHLNLVYATALRRCQGQTVLVDDVCQTVFIDFARKAAVLSESVEISAWLHRHACFVSSNLLRAEARRTRRENVAMQLQDLSTSPDWDRLAPVLDEALLELPETDRTSLVLRFLEQRTFADVGSRIGLTEEAARKRVNRALDGLRSRLSIRGIASTSAALAIALGGPAIATAPSGLEASVARAAISCAAHSFSTAGLVTTMISTKFKLGLGLLLTTAALTVFWTSRTRSASQTNSSPLAARPEVASAGIDVARRSLNRPTQRPGLAAKSNRFDQNALTREILEALSKPPEAGTRGYPPSELTVAIERWENHCEEVFAALREHVANSNPEVVHRAISGIGWLGRRPGQCHSEMRSYLWALFREASLDRRDWLFSALSSLHFESEDLPSLVPLLVNPASPWLERYVPEEISRFLQKVAPDSVPDLGQMVQLLDHKDPSVRFRAACALSSVLAATDPRIAAEIRRPLTDPDSREALEAIETAQRVGAPLSGLAPDLAQFANSTKDTLLAEIARLAQAAVAPQLAAQDPAVSAALSADALFQSWLRRLGRETIPWPELVDALSTPALQSLGDALVKELLKTEPLPEEAAAKLGKALVGHDANVRDTLLEMIHRTDPAVVIQKIDPATILGGNMAAYLEAIRLGDGKPNSKADEVMSLRLQSWWTPEELVAYVRSLGKIDPRLPETFVAQAVSLDPSLATKLSKAAISPGK